MPPLTFHYFDRSFTNIAYAMVIGCFGESSVS
jgi:hypothetical protein